MMAEYQRDAERNSTASTPKKQVPRKPAKTKKKR
jgi:hypothetical protein